MNDDARKAQSPVEGWKLALLEIFAVLMLLYVMRTTSKLQKQYAMDLEVTEARLQNVTMTGMSMIMIAHRLETIAGCDQIYVVEHGRITQHGTHDELKQMDGLYSNLLKYA